MPRPELPVQAVLFDFDGVIGGAQGSIIAARQLLRSKKLHWTPAAQKLRPLDIVRIFEFSDLGDNYKSVRLMYQKFRPFLPHRIERLNFLRKMGKLYPKYDQVVGKIIPGIKEILEELHRYGVPIAIVSNSTQERVESLTAKFGIQHLLTTIVTRSDMKGYDVKPSPFPILICLRKLRNFHKLGNIRRDRVYFVGDLPSDVQCAHNAKVRSIAVLSGHGFHGELLRKNPDYILDGVKNLFNIPEFQKLKALYSE